MSEQEIGRVKWFNENKGYGFIEREQGGEVFVHFNAIQGKGRRTLHDNDRVRFTVSQGKKGLQAEEVSVEE